MLDFLIPSTGSLQETSYDLTDDYRQLAKLRHSADALQTGHVVFLLPIRLHWRAALCDRGS